MKALKVLTITVVLFAPAAGFAMGCNTHKQQQVMSCAEGSTWDSASQSCIPLASS